jgi:4-hydroxymandelate oxidase
VPAEYSDGQPSAGLGHSYGEMAQMLISSVMSPDEPVDLLVLAFSLHDVRPGQQTAAYLSNVAPGAPMAFAVCDQGSAAAFSGLRIAREYASSAGIRRALLIVVEQATLPYDCPIRCPPAPGRHRALQRLRAHWRKAPNAGQRGPRCRRAPTAGCPSSDVAGLYSRTAELAAGYGRSGWCQRRPRRGVNRAGGGGRTRGHA